MISVCIWVVTSKKKKEKVCYVIGIPGVWGNLTQMNNALKEQHWHSGKSAHVSLDSCVVTYTQTHFTQTPGSNEEFTHVNNL